MCRFLVGLLTLSFRLLGACTDPYGADGFDYERRINADIFAAHDAGAPTIRNLGQYNGRAFLQ